MATQPMTTEERAAWLENRGVDMSWWRKDRQKPVLAEPRPTECGYFSVKLAQGEYVFNLTHDGKPYKVRCRLPKFAEQPFWFCYACNAVWFTREEAQAHRNLTENPK